MKTLLFWGLTEKSNFKGWGVMKNQYKGGLLKKGGGGLWQFANLKVGLARKRRGWAFQGGVDTPMHTMGTIFILASYSL